MRTAAAVMLIGLSASACTVTVDDGGGGGGGGGDGAPRPAPLPSSLSTLDNDGISVAGQPGSGAGQVRLCLKTQSGMWAKQMVVDDATALRSENGSVDCTEVEPGPVRLGFIKAKALGFMTGVGYGNLDLTGWGGGTVTVEWQRD